ncbi:MAG: hypothetical protein KKB79_02170 [Nanoarchaeota archaeon]|nr:hypothetical protein [Nanoarchaeota archaeon]
MGITLFNNEGKLSEQKFDLEEDFEREVVYNSKKFFGEKTIYLDVKKKIKTVSLGGAIPDGILFNLEDPEDIKFFLVESELAKHDFYKHIFPQITKFLAFFKSQDSLNLLVDKIYSVITEDDNLLSEFRKLLGNREIYKSIKDSIENSQNILLIIDEDKEEFEEIMNTYTDTWDKFVRIHVLKKYKSQDGNIYVLDPDFVGEDPIFEIAQKDLGDVTRYTEGYHLEGTSPVVQNIYKKLKERIIESFPNLIFNPQKYYVSIRNGKNIAYFHIKKKKINLTLMLSYEKGSEIIKNHRLKKYTEGIEKFYGGPSFEVVIETEDNLDEIFEALKKSTPNLSLET